MIGDHPGIDPTHRRLRSEIVDALRTDLYELTMAAGYFHRGMTGMQATCEMFVRHMPRARRYLVAMGIERVLDYLQALRFSEEQIAFLSTVPALRAVMTAELVGYLRQFRFTGDVWGVPEGTVVFANEPLLRVRAPIVEAQIIETFLLSAINHATTVASKAARIVRAAADAGVMEFGSRRTHPEAAVDAARAAYAVGCVGTSNVEAGMRFGIPVLGTAAHMWTMAHPSEEASFESYLSVFPDASILLIDTYDTLRGAERAVRIAGGKLRGVRLDSGDLATLSRAVRKILDDAGCHSAIIVASGDLNEFRITELRRAGAPIDLYGVGTDLVTSIDAPSLGGIYKLVEITRGGEPVPIAKFSEGKVTFPGAHQVLRVRDEAGRLAKDMLVLEGESPAELGAASSEPLLVPLMRRGMRTGPSESLAAIRARANRELAALPPALHELHEGEPFSVTPSERLLALQEKVRGEVAVLARG